MVHGEVELALNLAAVPGALMTETFRRREGPSRLQLTNTPLPDRCVGNINDCPLRTLVHITRRPSRACPVDMCDVTPREAFVVNEQKMVDVMIASDLLYFCRDSTAIGVALTTCDSDLLPALCYGATTAVVPIILLPLSDCWTVSHVELLTSLGVRVKQIGAADGSQ